MGATSAAPHHRSPGGEEAGGGGRGWREREMKSSDRLCLLAVRFSNSLQLLKRNLEQE